MTPRGSAVLVATVETCGGLSCNTFVNCALSRREQTTATGNCFTFAVSDVTTYLGNNTDFGEGVATVFQDTLINGSNFVHALNVSQGRKVLQWEFHHRRLPRIGRYRLPSEVTQQAFYAS